MFHSPSNSIESSEKVSTEAKDISKSNISSLSETTPIPNESVTDANPLSDDNERINELIHQNQSFEKQVLFTKILFI